MLTFNLDILCILLLATVTTVWALAGCTKKKDGKDSKKPDPQAEKKRIEELRTTCRALGISGWDQITTENAAQYEKYVADRISAAPKKKSAEKANNFGKKKNGSNESIDDARTGKSKSSGNESTTTTQGKNKYIRTSLADKEKREREAREQEEQIRAIQQGKQRERCDNETLDMVPENFGKTQAFVEKDTTGAEEAIQSIQRGKMRERCDNETVDMIPENFGKTQAFVEKESSIRDQSHTVKKDSHASIPDTGPGDTGPMSNKTYEKNYSQAVHDRSLSEKSRKKGKNRFRRKISGHRRHRKIDDKEDEDENETDTGTGAK